MRSAYILLAVLLFLYAFTGVPVMTGTSYLLAIDGSEESRSAAYFTWELANQSGSRVVAQHVVDTAAIWRFLSHDRAGFIGSGIFMDAREQIIEIMHSVADSLMLSYDSQIDGQALNFENVIDEGEPAAEIARRAKDHDLVILGYRGGKTATRRASMFEKLAEVCPCPILVVRNTSKTWSSMQMFVTNEIDNSDSISHIYQLGTMLGVRTEVYLDANVAVNDFERFTLGGWSPAFGVRQIENGDLKNLITAAPDDVLLVVSAEAMTDQYAVRYRSRIRAFLDDSDRRALLLWRDKTSYPFRQKLAS